VVDAIAKIPVSGGLSAALRKFQGPYDVHVILSLRRIRDFVARHEKRILLLAGSPQDDKDVASQARLRMTTGLL
jgi:hypothetical protein